MPDRTRLILRLVIALAIGIIPIALGSWLAYKDLFFFGPEGIPLPLAIIFMAMLPPVFSVGLIPAILFAALSKAFAAWIILGNRSRFLFLRYPPLNAAAMITLLLTIKA